MNNTSNRTSNNKAIAIGLVIVIILVLVGAVVAKEMMKKEEGTGLLGGNDHGMHHDMAAVTSDEEFLSHMKAHHQEAIDSSEYVLDNGVDGDVLRLAGSIVTAQQAEIEQMDEWHEEWHRRNIPEADYTPMMRDLSKLSGSELDVAFMEDMIKHHKAAIVMAEQILQITERDEVEELARNIIETQADEVDIMEDWLADHAEQK